MRVYHYRKITPLRVLAMALRGLSSLLLAWPWLLVLGVLFSPYSPALLIDRPDPRHTHPRAQLICTYRDFGGQFEQLHRGWCPWITISKWPG